MYMCMCEKREQRQRTGETSVGLDKMGGRVCIDFGAVFQFSHIRKEA